MSDSINAANIDAIEQSLESGGASADALGLLPDADAAAGDVPDDAGLASASQQGLDAEALAFLIGTGGPDTILGGDGTDVIDARGGNDAASGSGGGDVIFGGAGDDLLAGDGPLAITTFPPPQPPLPAGDDLIVGGDGDDTLYGDGSIYFGDFGDDAGNNVLFGGAGNDFIVSGYGSDTASGGSGDDVILGFGASIGRGSGGQAAIEGDRGDLLFGGAGNDSINGGGGGDAIDGGVGDDRLTGGVGVDTLTGGPGADTFVFGFGAVFMAADTGRGEGNRDVVADFESGVDLLDLTGYRSPSVTWSYDEAGDRTIVTIVDPRSAFGFGPYEIELAGVRNLTADDILV